MRNLNYGQIAYDAYKASASGVSLISGARLPEWALLLPAIQTAWQAAARAVITNALDATNEALED